MTVHAAIALIGLATGASVGWCVACLLTTRSLSSDLADLEAQADALDRSRRQLDRDADLLDQAKRDHWQRVAVSVVRQVNESVGWAGLHAKKARWLQ